MKQDSAAAERRNRYRPPRRRTGMRGAWASGVVMVLLLAGCSGDGGGAPLGAIEGLVLDDAYRPVPGALVILQETGRNSTTDAQGQFQFLGLEPSTYSLVVSWRGYESAPQAVTVSAGATVEATLAVDRVFPWCLPGDAMPKSVLQVNARNLAFDPKESEVPRGDLPMMLKVVDDDPVPHKFRYEVVRTNATGGEPLAQDEVTIPPGGNKVFHLPIVPACDDRVDVKGMLVRLPDIEVRFSDPDLAAAGMTGRIAFKP